MAAKRKQGEPALGAPIWMLSFSDCMTNLLTFFILLLTFSAFGDFGGGTSPSVGPKTGGFTVHVTNQPERHALLPAPISLGLLTPEGSERPDPLTEPTRAQRPRAPIGILDAEAHRDRKVFHIPSALVFYGWGSFLTERGRQRLDQVAELLRLQPCQVVIGESSHLHPNHRLFHRPNGHLDRAWAVLHYLSDKGNLPQAWFSLAPVTTVGPEAFGGEPVVEVVLMARRVYP